MAESNKNARKTFSQTIRNIATRKPDDTIILKYLTNSRDYKMGQKQTIVSEHIVIGRDSSCEVRYDDKFDTVSRIHASISKLGEEWTVKNLSKSNPTLINGTPVNKSWFLSNGDVIQFSFEGPKIEFSVPALDEKKSIPWSVVIKEQIIRPYKKLVITASILLLLVMSSLVYIILDQGRTIGDLKYLAGEIELIAEEQAKISGARLDSIQDIYEENIEKQKNSDRPIGEKITPYFKDIWHIQALGLEMEFEGEKEYLADYEWSGTGFLLNDGRLITAGHVIRPWLFAVDDEDKVEAFLNILDNGGGSVRVDFVAVSPDGKKINFSTKDVRISNRRNSRDFDIEGNIYEVKEVAWENDWAWIKTKFKGSLTASYLTSNKLDISSKVHILGYPYSFGVSDEGMTPLYSSSDVSTKGLADGMIQLTNRNFEPGNSGGPALYEENGKLKVVGIVSSGVGTSLGYLVPISKLK
jgi:pSer/pThr/pTyr-binding forkhead associated (FHA) protein|tara:strand:- start:6245 stop:7648 length:1404 start_codon:yes stop_codon:yes gene_type:complete